MELSGTYEENFNSTPVPQMADSLVQDYYFFLMYIKNKREGNGVVSCEKCAQDSWSSEKEKQLPAG